MTIHNLDPEVERRIREEARQKGQSLNQTIKRILAEAVGGTNEERAKKSEFAEFCGNWSDADVKEFEEAIADLERVKPEEWK